MSVACKVTEPSTSLPVVLTVKTLSNLCSIVQFQAVQEEEEEKVSQSSEGSAMDILGVISRWACL